MNILRIVDVLRQDLKYALRQARLHPGFALTAILSLALGIGANTAIFTLVDNIILRLLPVQDPRELVQLHMEGGRMGSQSGDGRHTFSHPFYRYLAARNTVFTGVTGQYVDTTSFLAADRAERVRVGLVAGNFFSVLGVQPHLGRMLTPDDDRARNGHPVVVLQYDFWRNRFSGDRNIVGTTMRLNDIPFTVIGVAGPGFEGTDPILPVNIWVPIMMKPAVTNWDELENERYAWFYLFARLKPGVTLQQAEAELKVLYRQRQVEEVKGEFFAKFPELKERFMKQSPNLIPASRGQSGVRSTFGRPLLVLQWLVGFVLLIACTNVANLLLARAAARQREVAIRAALGASRAQLVRQLLVESLLYALLGGVAGLALSSWVARGLVRFLPFDPANLSLPTTPDLRVLLFTSGVTLVTVLLFGLVPALRASRVSPGATLKDEAGAIAGGHSHVRLRKALVGVQVGLSCLLLIGAGLFARTIRNLQNVQLGFDTENVVMFGVTPAMPYPEPRKLQVYRSLVETLATVPGVVAVGANRSRLLTGGRWDSSITIPGVEAKEGNQPWSFFNAVTPGYFQALGIPIKAGRDVTWADWGGTRRVCLVNEALVKEYMGGSNPVGRMMAQGAKNTPDTEIIGVFGDSKYHDVRGEIPRQTFLSMHSHMRNIYSINVYARVQGDPRQIMPMLQEQVRRLDSNLIVTDMRTLDQQLDMRLANERMLSFLSTGFALLASLLAVVGLHGVLAFIVTRRTREIGIRLALGAGQSRVIRLVMGEVLLVILAGITAAVITGVACGRFVESQLFGVKAGDPPVFAMAVAVLLGASLMAAFIPARRAAKMDPMRALRYE